MAAREYEQANDASTSSDTDRLMKGNLNLLACILGL